MILLYLYLIGKLDPGIQEKEMKHLEELGRLSQEIEDRELEMKEREAAVSEEKERLKEELAEAQNVCVLWNWCGRFWVIYLRCVEELGFDIWTY